MDASGLAAERLRLRALLAADQAQLWHWLHLALWDPPPAGLRPPEVLQTPHVRVYAEDWGRETDIGVVAVVDGIDAGACWMRRLTDAGAAFVDAATPQLGIALEPRFRGAGFGKALMAAALNKAWTSGCAQVSLTVHPKNPAIALYESLGFQRVDERGGYHLMIARRALDTHGG